MTGNCHVRCGSGEKPEVFAPEAYLSTFGKIPNFEKLIATIRSREISASIILQSMSQLKSIYKDNADTVLGNCDTLLFLGGKEKTTLKDMSETLGKETIDLFNTSDTRGNSQSMGVNYQKTGKELPYLIVKSSDAHKIHRTGTRSSGRSSGQAAVFNRYSVCTLALQPVSF